MGPPPTFSSFPFFLLLRTVRLHPRTGLYFRKTSAINPSICASMTFHPCTWERARRPIAVVRVCMDGQGWNHAAGLISRRKLIFCLFVSFQTNHVGRHLLPTVFVCVCVRVCTCVCACARRWPFVPWSCGLNCMPVLMSSYQSKRLRESAHDCLIHTMQNWNCSLYCRWLWVFLHVYKLKSWFSLYSLIHMCKPWSHRNGYINILIFQKLALFTLDFVLRVTYLHIYEFILLLYIIYFLSSFQRVFDL